jgi:tetratricopeptide (TPR) repeat protein
MRRVGLPVSPVLYLTSHLPPIHWELLYHKGRFLVADTSIALSRYPAGTIPLTPALAELPLRVLLVLSEPVDASPIFPEEARRELVHGLRTLDEAGAVIVDRLRPPTFDTLVEALRNGAYHMLIFYGHGAYGLSDGVPGGHLLFEDEFGGGELIQASQLGAVLRNTDVRLVLLGACQSAQVGPHPFSPSPILGEGPGVRADVWSGTAPALLRGGVPLAIGMQVSMRVDAAQAFIRHFALSLAAGKTVVEAVGDARLPLIRDAYGKTWFIPALYGRPSDEYRLFDPGSPLPDGTLELRAEMKARRVEIARLEEAAGGLGMLSQPGEIAGLRAARAGFARARAELARRTPAGYAAVVSPLYGVPSNPVFVGRAAEIREVSRELRGEQPVVIWGAGGIGKTALAIEVAHRQGWRFPGGVLWLDCRGGPAFDTLLDRLGAFCGMEDMTGVDPGKKEMAIRGGLAGLGERCLLAWDNAEEVDQWERAEAWEAFVRNARALVGSLDRLGYWGEIGQRLERAREAVHKHPEAPPDMEAGLVNDLATIAYKRAEWEQAIAWWEEATGLYQAMENEKGLSGVYNNLGNVYQRKGEWERAIEFYQNALETMERVGDIHGMAQTYNNLGLVYADKGEWERAIEFYQKSLETKERVGDIHGMASTWANLGLLYLQTDQTEEARPLLARAYLIFAKIGSPHAETAARALVQACGSAEAAEAYLAQVAGEE